ncbi:MAG: hypothetical protein IIB26_01195 [Chloroflexi bacterium]|nr:hypothetical protein [Chloroflexota bacterium]
MTGILNIALWRMAAFAVLIPIAMVAVFLIWQDYEARRSATITNLGLKSAQINAQLEDFVNTADAATGALATLVANVNPGLVHGASLTPGVAAPADQLLLGFLSRSTQFSEAAIVDVSGKVLAASHPFVTGTRDDYREFLGSPPTREDSPSQTCSCPAARMSRTSCFHTLCRRARVPPRMSSRAQRWAPFPARWT